MRVTYLKFQNLVLVLVGFSHLGDQIKAQTETNLTCHDTVYEFNCKYVYLSSIGNTLITEGETSYPFYFYTLPTTPPIMMACESTLDSITFKWKKPTTGMVDQTVYHYDYSLSQGNSGMANEGM